MKKLSICILAMILSFTFVPTLSATNTPVPAKTENPAERAEAQQLIQRLEYMKKLDVKSMDRSERKAHRKEVKSIKTRLNAIGGGVYISASALILILILLIIFL